MVFGRHVLARVPGFDEELGPGALGFHDETLFTLQLKEAGFKVRSRFDIAVEHHFDTTRLTRSGMLSLAERMGRSDAYLHYHWLHMERTRNPYWEFRRSAGLFARRLLALKSCYINHKIIDWEIERVKEIAYFQQFEHERRHPRNYEKRGLRKLRL